MSVQPNPADLTVIEHIAGDACNLEADAVQLAYLLDAVQELSHLMGTGERAEAVKSVIYCAIDLAGSVSKQAVALSGRCSNESRQGLPSPVQPAGVADVFPEWLEARRTINKSSTYGTVRGGDPESRALDAMMEAVESRANSLSVININDLAALYLIETDMGACEPCEGFDNVCAKIMGVNV